MAAIKVTCLAVGAAVILAIFCTGEVESQFEDLSSLYVTCPGNYINIYGKCLLFVVKEREWKSASVGCYKHKGELATNLDECQLYEHLLRYIESHKDLKSRHFWVGGTDLDIEGIWKWTNGDSINMGALYWGQVFWSSQPDGGTDQNCLVLSGMDRHSFHDAPCSRAYSYICQPRLKGPRRG